MRSGRRIIQKILAASCAGSEVGGERDYTGLRPSPLRGRRLTPTLSHACGARLEPKGSHRASLHRIYRRPHAGPSIYGGERGIRTLDGLLTHTPLAGARLQPLGHLSVRVMWVAIITVFACQYAIDPLKAMTDRGILMTARAAQ